MAGKTAIIVEGGKIENESWVSTWRWLYVEGELVDEDKYLSVHRILKACTSHNVSRIGVVYDVVGSDWSAFHGHSMIWKYKDTEELAFQGGKELGEELWKLLVSFARWPDVKSADS